MPLEQIELDGDYVLRPAGEDGTYAIGEAFHVERNDHGGSLWTPVASYFVWRKQPRDGYHRHWRIDCFVKDNPRSPEPEYLAKRILMALVDRGVVSEPVWLSWHRSKETGGTSLGEFFDFD
jgi:hypothetical protein